MGNESKLHFAGVVSSEAAIKLAIVFYARLADGLKSLNQKEHLMENNTETNEAFNENAIEESEKLRSEERKGSGGSGRSGESNRSLRRIVRAAVIAALYVSLTMLVMPVAYGPVQFRASEALTILPLFFPEAVIGLSIGCFIANIFGNGALDLAFGTAATLIAASLTFLIGRIRRGQLGDPLKVILGILPPILINALVVPFTFLALTELGELYWFNVLTVGAGQAAVLTLLGIPLYYAVKRLKKTSQVFN